MSTIKSLAVLGVRTVLVHFSCLHADNIQGAGTLGAPVLKAIIDSGKFNITVITRPSSTSTFPSGIKIVRADPTSIEELTTALKGQDAVVSTVARAGVRGQTVLVDAAIAVGVKRILPSEYAGDLSNPNAATLPPFADKIHVRKYIEAKVAAGAEITYSFIVSSIFLDWGLDCEMLLEVSSIHNPIAPFGFRSIHTSHRFRSLALVLGHVLTPCSFSGDLLRQLYTMAESLSSAQQHLLLLERQSWES